MGVDWSDAKPHVDVVDSSEEGNLELDPILQGMVDRAAIRDVMVRYARGLDRRDFDLVTSCFTSDAYADYRGHKTSGIDNIIQYLRRIDRFQRTMHFMGDQFIEIYGDTAEVETYAIDYLWYAVDGIQYISTGGLRYSDKMLRREGKWLIYHRVMHLDWRHNDAIDLSAPGIERV